MDTRETPDSGSRWVKSSLSFSNGNCVEVAALTDGGVGVRNSRFPEETVMEYTQAEWVAFMAGVKAGEFDHLTGGYEEKDTSVVPEPAATSTSNPS